MPELKQMPTTIRKKIKIYVDFSVKDDMTFGIGQRLVSFFGQSSIFENTEEITDYVEEFFDSLTLNFLTFGEDDRYENDFFKSNNELEGESLKYLNNEINLATITLSLGSFFLPVVIYFHYTDKRTDFFILSSLKKRYQINIHKWNMVINYIKLKEKKFGFFGNINYFENIKKYFNTINLTKNFNVLNFSNILELTTVTYLMAERIFVPTWSNYMFTLSKENNRFLFSKSYKFKLVRSSMRLLKKLVSLPIHYILNVVALKVVFLDEEFEYANLMDSFMHYVAQLYISKKSLFRRLRRRKRFKKKISRNFYGNKVTYYKIYAINNNKKKKKR